MLIIENEKTFNIEGIEAVTVQQFARLTHRSENTIRRLISTGNQYRKLQVLYVMGKPLVPVRELQTFPFTVQGREQRDAFHLELDKEENVLKITESEGYCSSEDYVFCDFICKGCKHYRSLHGVSIKDKAVQTSK